MLGRPRRAQTPAPAPGPERRYCAAPSQFGRNRAAWEAERTPMTPGEARMSGASVTPRGGVAAALAVVYIAWGSTFVAMRVAVRSLPPLTMSGMRFLTAGLLLYCWCLWQRRRHPEAGWRAPTPPEGGATAPPRPPPAPGGPRGGAAGG